MVNAIEAKEIVLKDLFDSKFLFNIPGYQRPFSWEEDNFNQLFDDLYEALENEEEAYFLGSIIMQTKSLESDDSGFYDVVDGQQRLTTLTILMATMRDLSSSQSAKRVLHSKIYQEPNEYENKSENVRLKVRDKDKQFFKEHVLEMGGTKRSIEGIKLTDSQKKVVNAIEVFSKKFQIDKENIDQELLDEFIKFLLNKTVLVYVKTSDLTSAFRLFSVLNARGLELTTSDLLKSENLSVIVEREREYYQRVWETIEDELGRDELDKLIGFIRTIFIKEKARKSIYEEYIEMIYNKNRSIKGKGFIEHLNRVANVYKDKVLNAEICHQQDSVMFFNLMTLMRDHLKISEWIPPFIAFALKFPQENYFLPFLKQLEKKVVTNWVRGLTPTERIVEMNKALQIIEQNTNAVEIINHPNFNVKNIKKELEVTFTDNYFYQRNFCKYILLRLDIFLSENSNIKKSYAGTISIEHVLPQNPTQGGEWEHKFNSDQREVYTNRIGNLVLLSRKKNSSANNRPFNEKKISYYQKGITDFDLTKEILSYNDWTPLTIDKRQNECIQRLKSIWVD
ncbi:hypothetical protein DEAC_c24160 [Desulfosporosinus acididurans]|uniref:DUF262 domain-containing protein n=1 Tax=Desulfosporosinus acididurans TaxID=476652 RepID=A0A0J1IM56_9FIRM|nr:DUF262 domain-containing protein [Desulfosporosinus acididurans]KLU65786.1 hypothetical protein DEAC_c24160 [Desulfosporosinus acididurans]